MEAIFTASAMFGPANCWTGTTGDLCAMIRELLRERESLLQTIANMIEEAEQNGMERDLCDE